MSTALAPGLAMENWTIRDRGGGRGARSPSSCQAPRSRSFFA
ncbi:Uncharacterised protein [Amycolatopsis camponoti]|uniref:Uncharacterized protein n=1 Tax=Amycolatopsis camponoti TaxID=2606593 RepID=A0A6I8LME0_9PSEU|nr:Uncharacterised protein [Amycolatopsis camponoti]